MDEDATTYEESDMQVLYAAAAFRIRPGMYIGSTCQRGLLNLVHEVAERADCGRAPGPVAHGAPPAGRGGRQPDGRRLLSPQARHLGPLDPDEVGHEAAYVREVRGVAVAGVDALTRARPSAAASVVTT